MEQTPKVRNVILVTGMSGAGRSSALKAFEDMGHDAVDNLPLLLLPSLISQTSQDHHLAVGIDIRSHNFGPKRFQSTLDALKALPNHNFRVLFLDCEDQVLLKRYTETRRRHPIAGETLAEAIKAERDLIAPIKEHADEIMDTSQASPVTFNQAIQGMFALDGAPQKPMIQVISFSYRQGLPREADIVLDARCLTNPHYIPELQPLNGTDKAIQDFLNKENLWGDVFGAAQKMIETSIEGFQKSSRSYVIIACGCTGGQHRSVFFAEELSKWLSGNYKVVTQHRDVHLSRHNKREPTK